MKDKLLQIRVDDEFIEKIDNLQTIMECSNISETIRKVIDNAIADQERKNANCNRCIHKNVCFDFWQSDMVTCEEERNVECMNDSWSCDCKHYEMSAI